MKIGNLNTNFIEHISLARFKRRICQWIVSLFSNIVATADNNSSNTPTVTTSFNKQTGVLSLHLSGFKGNAGSGVAVKADANSCTAIGDAYIDQTSGSASYGHIMILTSLDPRTITDGGNIQGPQGADGVGIVSITKTGTSGKVDTYTITYTNGNTTTFTIKNGTDGINGSPGEDGTIVSKAYHIYCNETCLIYYINNPHVENHTHANSSIIDARVTIVRDGDGTGQEAQANVHLTILADCEGDKWYESMVAKEVDPLNNTWIGRVNITLTGGNTYNSILNHDDVWYGSVTIRHDNIGYTYPDRIGGEEDNEYTYPLLIDLHGTMKGDWISGEDINVIFTQSMSFELELL